MHLYRTSNLKISKKEYVFFKCVTQRYNLYVFIYTEQNYKRNTFVFAPIFHELNSKKIQDFFYVHKRPISSGGQ